MGILNTKIISAADKVYYILFKRHFKHNAILPDGFTVTCHAGAFHTKANSLESVSIAVEWGADIVEFDVSFRPDGTAVIIHESSPTMTQGVLLEDALKIVAKDKKCKINLDIKSTSNLPEVDRLVKKHGLFERVFYTGVFEDWVDTVKSTSAIPYYLNHNISAAEAASNEAIDEIMQRTKSLGAIGINSNYKNASRYFSDTAHKNGLLVSLWTVNKVKDMVRVIEMCPDNITTKKPEILSIIAQK